MDQEGPGPPLGAIGLDCWERNAERIMEGADGDAVEVDRMLLHTIHWAAARGATSLADCDTLLGAAIVRTMTWALGDEDEALRMEADVAAEASMIAAGMRG